MKIAVTILLSLGLAACGGGGDSNGGSDKTSALVKLEGVWKASEPMGKEGLPPNETVFIDEYYLAFNSSGLMTVYDYAGDSYDNYGNCYWIGNFQVVSKGNDKYEFTGMESNEKNVYIISADSTYLRIRPEGTSVENQSVLVISRLNTSDFTPLCNATSQADTSQDKVFKIPH